MAKQLLYLYKEYARDICNEIKDLADLGYDVLATRIVHPNFQREFENEPMATKHLAFSRSDLLLPSDDWRKNIITILDEHIDCDSPIESVRLRSEKVLNQELGFADHLSQYGHTLIKLKGQKTVNFARIISRNLKGVLLCEVPMTDPRMLKQNYRPLTPNEELQVFDDTWHWWNKFRCVADYHPNIKVALEIPADIPSDDDVKRWLGEPVECIILPSNIFIQNNYHHYVLSRAHQAVVRQFLQNGCHVMIKGVGTEMLKQHSEYLRYLMAFKTNHGLRGFEDIVEIPLQPLYDNLDAYTYEVFEKDPIKYKYYQNAIEMALIDRVPESEIDTKETIIMVVGAGRGPLVRSALNASQNTRRKVKIFIVEKNQNAIVTLTALKNELWPDKDITIFPCDMRALELPEKADIIVSELLGSFGDNELSPECLDGAQKHLKPDGISIPSKSTSYINPVMSPKIYNSVRNENLIGSARTKVFNYATQSENTYVIYMKNCYHIADPQPVFTFVHPNRDKIIDNSRFTTLKFPVEKDCVLHGFVGYFDTVLYKDIVLSIHPYTHSMGLSSWFSIYFPISEPQQLKADDVIEVNFWRCISSHKVWYEWNTTAPFITHIHNHTGRSCPIYL